MPTVTKSWSFASGTDGWTGMTWANSALAASGSITPPTGEQITADSLAKSATGTSWLTLGVPANATAVTGVRVSGGSRKRITCSNVSQWYGDFYVVNAANTSVIDPAGSVGSMWLPLGTDTDFVSAAGGSNQAVLAAYQDPSTVVRLLFDFSIESHVGPTTTTYSVQYRDFAITITYTVPYNFPALLIAP